MNRARELARASHVMPEEPGKLRNLLIPLEYVVSFLVGIAVTLAGRYMQFHLLGMPPPTQTVDLQLFADLILIGIVGVLLYWMANMETKGHLGAGLFGAFLVIVSFHNIVHLFPFLMGDLFSFDYVLDVRRETEFGTLLIHEAAVDLRGLLGN